MCTDWAMLYEYVSSAASAEDVQKNPSTPNSNVKSAKNLIINKELEEFNSGSDIRNDSRSSENSTEPVEFFNSHEELAMANALNALRSDNPSSNNTDEKNVSERNPNAELTIPAVFYNSR